MTETQLQSKIAVAFRDKYPEKRGQLFHVSNERNNKIQAFNAQGIGIVPGVTDYIYADRPLVTPELMKTLSRATMINKKTISFIIGLVFQELNLVDLVLIELKVKGTYHKKKHLQSQIRWGRMMESLGATWRLCTEVDEVISCTEKDYRGMTLDDLEEKINSVSSKTVTIKI